MLALWLMPSGLSRRGHQHYLSSGYALYVMKAKTNSIQSTCGICPVGCGVRISLAQGIPTSIKGDPDHPLNKGELCRKGLASLNILHHPQRLTQPLKRTDPRGRGAWMPIPWDEAFKSIASRLQSVKEQHGAESVAFVHGAAKGLCDSYLARLSNLFGSPNVSWQGHVCFVPRVLASKLTYGFYAIPDLDFPPALIVVWGKNTAETLPHAHTRIRKALNHGSKLIVIDPRQTELAHRADLWLQPRPGSDLALALSILHELIFKNHYDHAFVQQWTVGFPELSQHIQDFRPDRMAQTTWIPEEKVRQAARMLGEYQPACIQWGNAIDQGTNSFQTARAICLIRTLTGNLGRQGGDIPTSVPPLQGRRSPELELWSELFSEQFQKRLGADQSLPLPGNRPIQPQHLIHSIVEKKPYQVQALYIQGCNPLLTYPNARKARQALEEVDFLAVADLFMTPTAEMADIVLPAASYLEHPSIVVPPYSYPVVSVQQPVYRRENVRSDYEILAGLAKALGFGKFFWPNEETCLDAVLQPAGINFQKFSHIGCISGEKLYRNHEQKGFPTPSGKVELMSSTLAEMGFDSLPGLSLRTPEGKLNSEEWPYYMISWKNSAFRHSLGQNTDSLRSLHPNPLVWIHPETAAREGIETGEMVVISTPQGAIRQRAHLTEKIHPLVIGVDYAWWFPEKDADTGYGWAEANINLLTNDSPPYNKELGSTTLRGYLCRIRKDNDS